MGQVGKLGQPRSVVLLMLPGGGGGGVQVSVWCLDFRNGWS